MSMTDAVVFINLVFILKVIYGDGFVTHKAVNDITLVTMTQATGCLITFQFKQSLLGKSIDVGHNEC